MTQRHPTQNDTLTMVTTNVRNRQSVFRDPSFAREAVECLYRVQDLHPFFLYGFVIMPDHCHFLMMVPSPATLSNVIGTFKSGLMFDLGLSRRTFIGNRRARGGNAAGHGMRLWQRRFYSTIVHNGFAVLRYIHMNPVRAGLAAKPEDYPWSSASGQWDVTPLGGW